MDDRCDRQLKTILMTIFLQNVFNKNNFLNNLIVARKAAEAMMTDCNLQTFLTDPERTEDPNILFQKGSLTPKKKKKNG